MFYFCFLFKSFSFLVINKKYKTYRYAMKCLYKKRIKLKKGESLALNERCMLQRVSKFNDFCLMFYYQNI